MRLPPHLSITLAALLALAGASAVDAQPRYARAFDLVVCDSVTTLSVLDPWPGGEIRAYGLVARGDPTPADPTFEALIEVPIRSAVVLDSPAIAALQDLGAGEVIRAVGSRTTVYDGATREAIAAGRVLEVGYGQELDIERIIALQPDVIISSALNADDRVLELGRRSGIPVVVWSDWREEHPLGRAEWLTVAATLVGRTRSAEERLSERFARYRRIAATYGGIGEAERPQVLLNAPWRGVWAMPAGASYMARLIRDAGGRYPWQERDGRGSLMLDLEEVIAQAADADVWLNGNADWTSLGAVTAADPRLGGFGPVRTGEVYHYDRRQRADGANDFWEGGVLRPDLVLADLAAILHPRSAGDHTLYFYRQLQ